MHRYVVVAFVLVAGLALAGCGGDPVAVTTSSLAATTAPTVTASTVTTAPAATTTTVALQVPEQLSDFEVRTVAIDGDPWLVAVADTRELRSQGLMFVTELADLDGMVFVFDRTTTGSFWMKNTLIPLDIAFFREDGSLVVVLQMEPCGDADPCPSYGPGAEYRYAVEAPLGALIDLDATARLAL
jgi:hypothetical protein